MNYYYRHTKSLIVYQVVIKPALWYDDIITTWWRHCDVIGNILRQDVEISIFDTIRRTYLRCRDNHIRVAAICDKLIAAGIVPWFDRDRMAYVLLLVWLRIIFAIIINTSDYNFITIIKLVNISAVISPKQSVFYFRGDIIRQMSKGIDASATMVCFITEVWPSKSCCKVFFVCNIVQKSL